MSTSKIHVYTNIHMLTYTPHKHTHTYTNTHTQTSYEFAVPIPIHICAGPTMMGLCEC